MKIKERQHDSSALFIDAEDEPVDFALARFVFQHLSAPEVAAAEMFRLLLPGEEWGR